MAVDLSEEQFINSLKREVIPLGADLFGDIDEDAWIGYLVDAFYEAKLDGFLDGYSADEEGVITPDEPSDEDIDRKYLALVILYAGIRILRNRILNMNVAFRAKAGPVEYEQQNSASVLAEMLRQLRDTKDRIISGLESNLSDVEVLDAYSVRLFSSASYWGSPELM